MKKFLFAFLVGSVSMLATTKKISAQIFSKAKVFEASENFVKIDKLMSALNKTADLDDINIKDLRNFKISYKNANDVKWTKSKYLFTATFVSDGIQTTIYYDVKGRWLGSLKNYKEEKFDSQVRAIVKSSYYDYKIDYVKEIETVGNYGSPTYLVFIEDDTNFKVVRVGDGIVDVYEQFEKQENF